MEVEQLTLCPMASLRVQRAMGNAVTFADDVQQRYKHEMSGIGVKRLSPTADEFLILNAG